MTGTNAPSITLPHRPQGAPSDRSARDSASDHDYYFCTYLDQNYLARGLSLYHSLKQHCPQFQLWVLCMDPQSHRAFTNLRLPEIRAIALDEFERGDEALVATKAKRSRVEYYFTCTPSLPLYVLKQCPQINLITYLDADLFFFADPRPLFEELSGNSVGIIEHRFASHLRASARCGNYNVGWLSFRRDQTGLECLGWWRERCLEWCHDRCEDERYADQKYLDQFPLLFRGVKVLEHKGANVAPWNVSNYQLRRDAQGIWVDDQPLIFYHFHALKQVRNWLFKSNLLVYGAPICQVLRNDIYATYIRTVKSRSQSVTRYLPAGSWLRSIRQPEQAPRRRFGGLRAALRQGRDLVREVSTGDYYVSCGLLQGWIPRLFK
jgi:hypothetical protein